MNWTLRDATGVEKTLAAWGLAELARERVNQATDTVTFRATGTTCDADPLFAIGSTVQLFRGGTPWFYGRVILVPGRATAQGEEQLYRLAGPWWYLENLVFQQAWETTNGITTTLVSTNRSRLILGQKSDGTQLNSGAAIGEVLAYATARGVPITVGSVTPAALAPYEEALDLSCAEVIRRMLRWTPDAVAAFDYTTTPYPTLSILRRADLTPQTVPAYGAPVSGLDLTPRHDLLAPAVMLKFEQTNDLAGDTFTSLTIQSSPTTATGDELGALVMTLELSGARATYQKQSITVQNLPSSDASPGVLDWWISRFAWLGDFDESTLAVVAGTHQLSIENPASYPTTTLSNLPNELLQGSVASWMNLHCAPVLAQVTLQYSGPDTAESKEVWGDTKQRVLYTRVTGTDATTGLYRRLTSATEAEPIPAGLADTLFAAVGVLAYDGTLELTEQECSGWAAPGQLLNLSGGRTEWTTMNAQVQRVEEAIDTGLTRIVVGPAKHLGHADLQELLRINRDRRISYRLTQRTSGTATGNAAQVEGGTLHPRSDSIFRPSSGTSATSQPFQLINASDTSGLKVTVNLNSLLQQSLTVNDVYPVSGLGAAIGVAVGTRVWLEIDFDASGDVTAATIASGASGWSGYPQALAYSGSAPDQVQTSAFLLVGYLVAATSTLDGAVINGGPSSAPVSAKIVQCVTQNVLLRAGNYNGLPGIYPFPHHTPEAA